MLDVVVIEKAGFYATVVGSPNQSLIYQIDDKFPCLFDDIMGITLFPHRNRNHSRVRADGSGPGNGNDIRFFPFSSTAYHNSGNGIQHVSRLPVFFTHFFYPFLI
jgi:hypothetical protein